jgi:hypothetical protein
MLANAKRRGVQLYRTNSKTFMVLVQTMCCAFNTVYADSRDTCVICPVDMYCVNGIATHCPANSESPVGSFSSLQCIPAYTTKSVDTSTNVSTSVVVSFTVTLGMNTTEFDGVKRGVYTTGVAQAFSVTRSSVMIGSVTQQRFRRTVQSIPIAVQTIVTLPYDMVGSMPMSNTLSNLIALLSLMGITVVKVTGVIPTITPNTTIGATRNTTAVVRSNTSIAKLPGTSDAFVENVDTPLRMILIYAFGLFNAVCVCPVCIYVGVNRIRKTSCRFQCIPIKIHSHTIEHTAPGIPRRIPNPIRLSADVFNRNLDEAYIHPVDITNVLMRMQPTLHTHPTPTSVTPTVHSTDASTQTHADYIPNNKPRDIHNNDTTENNLGQQEFDIPTSKAPHIDNLNRLRPIPFNPRMLSTCSITRNAATNQEVHLAVA